MDVRAPQRWFENAKMVPQIPGKEVSSLKHNSFPLIVSVRFFAFTVLKYMKKHLKCKNRGQ